MPEQLTVGIDLWFEAAETPAFRPLLPRAGTAYWLFVDVALVPYGGAGTVATWYLPELSWFVERCAEDGERRELTVEIRPRYGLVGRGPLVSTTTLSPERIRAAASLAPELSGFGEWVEAQNRDHEPPVDYLAELRADAEAPFSIARFRFAVETGPQPGRCSLAIVLRGSGAGEEMSQSNELETSTDPDDAAILSLPWGAETAAAAEGPRTTEIVSVYYATDRRNTGHEELPRRYSGEPSDPYRLEHGIVRVNVPMDRHVEGRIERPWLRCFEDPERHFVLWSIRVLDRDGFFADLASATAETKQAFVFIHGYNVDFEEAAFRTAQIHVDLRDEHALEAVPILYSWPSMGEILAYATDEVEAENTAEHLAAFLRDVRRRSGAELVHLIAHSMGNRALTYALREIAAARPGEALFHEVVLAAPDIDVVRFRQLAARIRDTARRYTLYANSADVALTTSAARRARRQRVGDAAGDKIVVVPGVESVDATDLDTGFIGHSYATENQRMLRDLSQVFGGRPPASDDRALQEVGDAERRWWSFPGSRKPWWKRAIRRLLSSSEPVVSR